MMMIRLDCCIIINSYTHLFVPLIHCFDRPVVGNWFLMISALLCPKCQAIPDRPTRLTIWQTSVQFELTCQTNEVHWSDCSWIENETTPCSIFNTKLKFSLKLSSKTMFSYELRVK